MDYSPHFSVNLALCQSNLGQYTNLFLTDAVKMIGIDREKKYLYAKIALNGK